MRFISIAIVLFELLLSMPSKPTNKCVSINKFSDRQKEVIAYAYTYGKKYDLGLTLAAIAWHESCAGEYRMNFADPSAGIYHALIPGVIKRYKILKDNGFNRNVVGELLIRDDEFASKVAIDELLYWKKVRNGNLKDMIKSYNKGFSWEKGVKSNALANNYYNNIKEKINILSKYIPKHIANIKIRQRPEILSEFNANDTNNKDKAAIIRKIRRIEIATLSNDDTESINEAKKNKRAVISIYNYDDIHIKHEKTITMKSI